MKIDLFEVHGHRCWPVEDKLGEQKSRSMDYNYHLMMNATDGKKLLELLQKSVNYVAEYATAGSDQFGRTIARELKEEILQILDSNTIP